MTIEELEKKFDECFEAAQWQTMDGVDQAKMWKLFKQFIEEYVAENSYGYDARDHTY